MPAPTLHDLLSPPSPPIRYTLQDWVQARPEMSNSGLAGIELWLAALSEFAWHAKRAVLVMPPRALPRSPSRMLGFGSGLLHAL